MVEMGISARDIDEMELRDLLGWADVLRTASRLRAKGRQDG